MENDVLVIGIAGGTASGKTTLMKNLIGEFGAEVTVLSHDNYYKRHDEMPFEERCTLNYDEPAAFDTSLMVYHLDQLRHGQAIVPGVRLHRSQPLQRNHPPGAQAGYYCGGHPDF